MRNIIVGVMGPGNSSRKEEVQSAFRLGQLIAKQGWITLSGGRNAGVMDAVNQGAKQEGGVTVGILPTRDKKLISDAVDIPIITDMGSGRNNINVLSSKIIVACGMGQGTASEIALALKAGKYVILLNTGKEAIDFFTKLNPDRIKIAESPENTVEMIRKLCRY